MRYRTVTFAVCVLLAAAVHAQEWPSFRGAHGSGVADGTNPPIVWDLEKGINVKWKTAIPGLAHSSPIVWGDRVFVTTAVPKTTADVTFRHGEEAGVASTRDDVPHSWRVYALDKESGEIVWERVAYEGVPRTARHVMASQANATPATDGGHLAEGLYCYDLDGKLLWKRDLGLLKSARVHDPSYEWNTASSPVIYRDRVILQVDILENSFIAAFDIRTGKDVWRTERDEIPSWSTPYIYEGPPRAELVTLGGNFARGYDPDTGKELWRLAKHSDFPTPTPIGGRGLIFLTSGSGSTVQPIYAVRPGASGDITLQDDEDSNRSVAWSKRRGGSFVPTPLVYRDQLYVCNSTSSACTGILAAYNAETGERVYQERLTQGGSYAASPVAADGRLYFATEDGDVIVVKAGPTFERLAVNPMGELIMATPALTRGALIFRTQHHVVAVAESGTR
jgi:outer membrane protein assembly factor BamB